MLSEFIAYFQVGFQHITDLNGYDHILFVVALCVLYPVQEWKKVLVLITAFTLGHCVTLALATLKMINYRTDIVEFLIPLTILCTCIVNFFQKTPDSRFRKPSNPIGRYAMAAAFGLIHGLGFSNYLRSLLGKDESIVNQLFAFNVGLEIGQIFIVALSMGLTFLMIDIFRIKRYTWILIASGFVAGVTFQLLLEKYPF